MNNNLLQIIKEVAREFDFDWRLAAAFIEVESGSKGFDDKTGKILIQFEPVWFRRKAPYAPSGEWSVNKVDIQRKEWEAFNSAFKINADAAMESTSIGLGQIMGFHFKRLNFNSVGAMWDDAKKGLHNQVQQLLMFIVTDRRLLAALKSRNWAMVATLYNGAGYMDIARKYGREPYDESMKGAFKKYSTL
jgi:hypothetical protein